MGALALLTLGAWWFFAPSVTHDVEQSAAMQQVLEAKDERLARGEPDAPVRIVEYVDILCPYCAQAHEQVIPQLQTDFIDNGKVHYEVRLVAMIANDSHRAAEGAYCAAEQDKFWSYMDNAYRDTWQDYYSQNKAPQEVELFTEERIGGFIESTGVEPTQWQACMDDDKYRGAIASNREAMDSIGAYGTPHFVVNGKNYNGVPPYPALKAIIDGELRKAE